MPNGRRGVSARSITQLLNELNQYLDAMGQPRITKEQVPSGPAGFRFLDSRIKQTREQWQATLPWQQRILPAMGFGGPTPAQVPPARAGVGVGLQPPTGRVTPEEYGRQEFARWTGPAATEAAGVTFPAAPTPPTGLGVEVPPQPTEPPPEGFRWAFDRELNRWVPQFAGLEAQQRAQQELAQQQLDFQQQQARLAAMEQARQFEFQQQQAEFAREPAPITRYQREQVGLQEQQLAAQQQQFQQQLAFQQEQMQAAQAEQERQYRSQLAAQPINWLQYAAYTGEEPVVQPWMIPLGFQETGGAVTPQGQIGQPIPGFEAQAGQQGIQTFAGLPQLTTPSAQLQARWGPTAQAQFLGYRQARTGAAPQETQFRLGAGRAPTGAFGGFSRFR